MSTRVITRNLGGGMWTVRTSDQSPGDGRVFRGLSSAQKDADDLTRGMQLRGETVEQDFDGRPPESARSGPSNMGLWIMGALSAAALGALGWFGYKKYATTSMSKLMPVDPLTPIVSDVTATYKDKNGLPWAVRGVHAGMGLGKPLYNWAVRYKGDNNPVYSAKSLEWKDVGSTAMDAEMGLAACKRWIDSEVASYMKDAEGDLFG